MKRFTIIILLFLSFIGIANLFLPGYYSSHDGIGHVIRMEEFYKAFNDGQIPVRWSQRLYFGYGYPFFNFNYPSVYYFGVPLMKAGMSAIEAMKAETIFAYIASGILMYVYLRRKMAPAYALVGAVLYIYAPYRLSNIYVRGSVAESFAFIFPPLLLWGAEAPSLWLTFVVGLMGISHNISTLLLSAFFFGYLALQTIYQRNIRHFLKGTAAFVLGVLMAAFFIFPALLEKKWTFLDLTIAKDYPDHFVEFWQLFFPNWGYGGSIAGINDGMSFNLGIVQVVLFLFALKFLRKSLLLFFSAAMVFITVFFMLIPSKIFWDNLPLLPFVQFPWRFTMLTVPALAIAGAIGLDFLKVSKKRIAFVIFCIVFSASYMIFRNQTEYSPPITNDAIEGSTTWAHEQATRWLVPKPDHIPAEKIENATYTIESWKTGEHKYEITANKVVTENTMYYPGWKVFVDGNEVPINYDNGKINYEVSPGTHQIVTIFTETPLRKSLNLLSLGAFGFVVLCLLFRYTVPNIFTKH